MRAYITTEEAEKVERMPVVIGSWYTFYSDCVECTSDNDVLLRYYSGQPVRVLHHEVNDNEGGDKLFKVVAHNGDIFVANEGELNGWIFDTGQWVGPRVN